MNCASTPSIRESSLPSWLASATTRLFEKHGITNIGYWTNTIGGRSDELWYIVGFEDLGQRDKAWAAFQSDPEWQKVRAESEADGPIVHHIENRILRPTDFSPAR